MTGSRVQCIHFGGRTAGGCVPILPSSASHLLPFLEVQGLRAVREEEDEEKDVAEMRQHNVAEEVVPDAECLFQDFLHHDAGAVTSNRDQTINVAKLRRQDTVDGPGQRVTPVEPPPPNRQGLQD